jgi:2-methylcitrate dehydratase PrpD
MQPTQRLVALGRRVDPATLPANVITVAKHCVLDWLAVTLAGAREPLTRIVFEQAVRADAGGEASLLGFGRRASVLSAALLHGTAAHALDYDDTHWGLQGHPTAPVLGALWGLCERERASGLQLLAALVAGVEVECRLGQWLNPDHYARGFHATGTLGTFGAAAAAAHLLGLPERAFTHALALAGSQAAGLKSAFGSMAKPLHAGRAAQSGLLAALLASAGFSGAEAILEAEQGFAITHSSQQLPAADAAWPEGFAIVDTLFKYHAACHLTHATIEGLRGLLRAQHMAADEVEWVELALDATCFGVCTIESPRTGLELKFSVQGCAGLALMGVSTEDPTAFDDARATSPELRDWLERVELEEKPMAATRTELRVGLRDGRVLQSAFDSGVPQRDLRVQEQSLRSKFERLVGLPPSHRDALWAGVMALEEQTDLRPLLALLPAGS